jgi:rhamnogalacturonan acetylesterase
MHTKSVFFRFRPKSLATGLIGLLLSLASVASADDTPTPPPGKPTLFIVGDSTVRNGTRGQQGWGDPLIRLFDEKRIAVENHAMGGRSSRTFQTEGRWDKILAICGSTSPTQKKKG